MNVKEFQKWFLRDGNYNFFVDLYYRWLDEWRYEDINDYQIALNKKYSTKDGIKFKEVEDEYKFIWIVEDKDGSRLKVWADEVECSVNAKLIK